MSEALTKFGSLVYAFNYFSPLYKGRLCISGCRSVTRGCSPVTRKWSTIHEKSYLFFAIPPLVFFSLGEYVICFTGQSEGEASRIVKWDAEGYARTSYGRNSHLWKSLWWLYVTRYVKLYLIFEEIVTKWLKLVNQA